jgi:tetratricopeptide (TPR) repeat protein
MRYRSFGAALLVLVCALPARADDPAPASPQAEQINDQGKELYKNKDYLGAAAKFREAIQIYPDARYYFNLCATLEKAGDYDAALEACDAVYDHQPGDELKGKTGQRAAVIRAAKRKRDQDQAQNPTPTTPPR